MKEQVRVSIIFLLITTFLITFGCSSDDDNVPTKTKPAMSPDSTMNSTPVEDASPTINEPTSVKDQSTNPEDTIMDFFDAISNSNLDLIPIYSTDRWIENDWSRLQWAWHLDGTISTIEISEIRHSPEEALYDVIYDESGEYRTNEGINYGIQLIASDDTWLIDKMCLGGVRSEGYLEDELYNIQFAVNSFMDSFQPPITDLSTDNRISSYRSTPGSATNNITKLIVSESGNIAEYSERDWSIENYWLDSFGIVRQLDPFYLQPDPFADMALAFGETDDDVRGRYIKTRKDEYWFHIAYGIAGLKEPVLVFEIRMDSIADRSISSGGNHVTLRDSNMKIERYVSDDLTQLVINEVPYDLDSGRYFTIDCKYDDFVVYQFR